MREPQTVAQVLDGHVTLELASIDRMYLNVYVPKLQHVLGVVGFFKEQRGAKAVSSVLMEPMTTAFVRSIEVFAKQHRVPLITFAKGQRKEEVAATYLAQSGGHEGVLFIGKAQERHGGPDRAAHRSPNGHALRLAGPLHRAGQSVLLLLRG